MFSRIAKNLAGLAGVAGSTAIVAHYLCVEEQKKREWYRAQSYATKHELEIERLCRLTHTPVWEFSGIPALEKAARIHCQDPALKRTCIIFFGEAARHNLKLRGIMPNAPVRINTQEQSKCWIRSKNKK